MSASEKLKALEEDLGGEDWAIGIPLPQIVAVVEAAEPCADWVHITHEDSDALAAALAALDEALS